MGDPASAPSSPDGRIELARSNASQFDPEL
jgi:hypothetical protein